MKQLCASRTLIERENASAPVRTVARTGAGLSHALTAAMVCLLGACGSETPATSSAPATTAHAPATAGTLPTAGTTGTTPATTPATAGSAAVPTGTKTAATGPATPLPDGTAAPGAAAAAPGGGAGILPCSVSKTLASNCQNCHGAMPVGAPMPLVTYADLQKPAISQPTRKVWELVKERIHDTKRPMPPVMPLAAADLAELDGWLAGGALTGPASDATCATPAGGPTMGALSNSSRDFSVGALTPEIGETCYEFKVHGAQTAGDTSKFDITPGEFYEQFYYKIPWQANSVATAYATVADNGPVLHHWLLFSTNEAQAEGAHIQAPLPTLIGTDPMLLAGWAVGGPNVVAPPDVGFELPEPGVRTINVQWHFYNSTDKPQQDASKVQICTVPKATKKNIASITWTGTEDLNGNKWFGGAGMPAHMKSTFTTTCTPGRGGLAATDSIHIIGFEPHMHRIGKHMSTSVKHADGKMEMIFDKPFVFGNETHYTADFELKPGEQLVTSCSFDNDNDFGVPFGESTDTEMCYNFTFAYPAHALSNGAASLLGVPDTCW
jgi:hypothetical protein